LAIKYIGGKVVQIRFGGGGREKDDGMDGLQFLPGELALPPTEDSRPRDDVRRGEPLKKLGDE